MSEINIVNNINVNTLQKILVLGGCGFIGGAIQKYVLDNKLEDSFVFSYYNNSERIYNGLKSIKLDLLDSASINIVNSFPVVIYVAGNADHGLAQKDPLLDLNLNTVMFLNFMKFFRGDLILLSSQAVYYGLEGEIDESINHVPRIPYGLSKQMTEKYAEYFLNIGHISKLWILRLMYSYGKGEKERRLIPTCARAVHTGEVINIHGSGKSFVNPLPSSFVAEVLVKTAQNLQEKEDNFLEITNLNHPKKMTVVDMVKFLGHLKDFNYNIIDHGEEWPIRFWGNTEKISIYLKKMNIKFPDIYENLKEYFINLIKKEVKK